MKSGSYGSSPRMRGTWAQASRHTQPRRFIPADAGNVEAQNATDRSLSVHPRGCGERKDSLAAASSTNGSSPRMRGTFVVAGTECRKQRFIPADAGNVRVTDSGTKSAPVHPRGCGERPSAATADFQTTGSSPRMRGTFSFPCFERDIPRFIPADAGNVRPSRFGMTFAPVHPRGCGERVRNEGCRKLCAGSSPRMRGTYFL